MSFDGIAFMGSMLKIRRPKDYQPTASDSNGGGGGGPHVISTMVPDSPHKIFIGGIPFNLNEDEIIELLKPFGDLKAFHLVRENLGGQSKVTSFLASLSCLQNRETTCFFRMDSCYCDGVLHSRAMPFASL